MLKTPFALQGEMLKTEVQLILTKFKIKNSMSNRQLASSSCCFY
jgi:hypothetical protein